MPAVFKVGFVNRSGLALKVSRSRLYIALRFLRSHMLCQYKCLVDITVYDNPDARFRFAVVYNMLSTLLNSRVLVCTYTGKQGLESMYRVYPAANWLEREVWDLHGVFFIRHPDLRRLLTDYGFKHHPLQKDFPVSGHTEVSYSENEKRLLHCRVESVQSCRTFARVA
jgi:NADH:ubiquinone oxidoreductase subunit C